MPRARQRSARCTATTVRLLATVALTTACSAGEERPGGAIITLHLEKLPVLDPGLDGHYEAWAIGADATIASVGRFTDTADPRQFESPILDPEYFMITLEPPGDEDGRPSAYKLLGGRFDNGAATLSVTGYLTATVPLEETPGTHVLASQTDNVTGTTHNEDAGIWLYDPTTDALDAAHYLDFAPLTEGWSYEGWVVRDYGSPDEVWLSYGRFLPDELHQARGRDQTGLGYFSGRPDFEDALSLIVRFPGDDFLANPLNYPVPGDLALPLDLNGDASIAAPSRWTHVISVEPLTPRQHRGRPDDARAFFLRPYVNDIGEAPPETPRAIRLDPHALPGGAVTIND